MSDTHSKEVRSRNMAAIQSKDTKPELMVRKGLHNRGFRYGLHNKSLPGTPDLNLPKYDAVIFVNGCFWHQHDCPRFKMPQSNIEYWQNKFQRNKERDRQGIKELENMDKRIAVVWGCALKGKYKLKLETVIFKLTNWLKSDCSFIEIEGNY